MKLLLERLAQTERRLEQLEASYTTPDERDTRSTSQCSRQDEPKQHYPSPSTLSSCSGEWRQRSEAGPPQTRRSEPEPRSSRDDSWRYPSTRIDTIFDSALLDDQRRLQYLGKAPIVCEEERQPFPNVLDLYEPSNVRDIALAKQRYFSHLGVLYPLICESTLRTAADAVEAEGFQENMRSCLVLLVIATIKAFMNVHSPESGLADFQRAMQLRSRISGQLNLQYVHVLVFSAIFLFQKDRLLDFVEALHCACTMLQTVIQR